MPTLQIELDAQTASRLYNLSQTKGQKESEIASLLLRDILEDVPIAPLTEKQFLAKISAGWESERWERYRHLTKKREDKNLSDNEYE